MKHLASWNEKLALAGCALKGSIFPADVGIFVEENDKREYKLEALPEKREMECQILYGMGGDKHSKEPGI